eukprot:TRINITY_DN299_c0_g2_i1.p1 TRINITY_DN299_c0_g2~~TRINITY_DN299_c0_g2_i1.p1  ORF type:complete len:618 (+),score=146.01 TRINITY_DN299_c0_g2_i1:48-1901(+)
MKYILVTGGVLSGIGKGIIASSTGMIMKAMGFRVTSIKIDPYLNIDAGTMSPFEHGEVFVLDDGGEVDLDLGNYERFLDITLSRDNNITTGKIYNHVIEKERRGEYLGKTVQVVPHVCDEIQAWIERVSAKPTDGSSNPPDICVIELGGTVGDIESMPFIEAMRQFQFRVGTENFCLMHVSLVPVIGVVGEHKTKPTQQSVRELRALGLTPDLVMCRSGQPLTADTQRKISNFCHVHPQHVIGVHDVSNIYRVPLLLQQQGLPYILLERLHLLDSPVAQALSIKPYSLTEQGRPVPDITPAWLQSWAQMADTVDRMNPTPDTPARDESPAGMASPAKRHTALSPIRIAMVGKYTGLGDSYLSVTKALDHASMEVQRKVVVDWVEAEELEEGHPKFHEAWRVIRSVHGILVPGGFGDRGIEGMVAAARYARTHNKPYLGICLGMQVAVIEYARSVLNWTGADSEEFNKEADPKVVVFMPEISKTHMGATMRLGVRKTIFNTRDCITARLYGLDKNPEGEPTIDERHRHRYEVNPEIVEQLQEAGLNFVGHDTEKVRMEVIELPKLDYFVGVQFHPEFKSRPKKPSPVFVGLVLACWRQEISKNLHEGELTPSSSKKQD